MTDIRANSFDRFWGECQAELTAAFQDVGASGWYVLGQHVAAFEASLARYSELPYAIGCANGMDAIEISLRLLGVGVGDKVLTTPMSAFATTLAILRVGAVPVFSDTDEYGLLDPSSAAQALAEHPDITCIVPVHLYGHLFDMEGLKAVADAASIPIIEDAAQAVGARRGSWRVGQVGVTTCISFYPTKNLGAIGDGGALLLSDPEMDERARSLRNYGQTERYVHDNVGLNSRLDEVHAAMLDKVMLPKLDAWTDRRRQIAKRYLAEISNPNVSPIGGIDPDGAVWHLFPVRVAPDRRGAFMDHLSAAGIQVGQHYPILIPDQKAMLQYGTPIVSGSLTSARALAETEVSLPIQPFLTQDEVGQVIEAVNGWAE